MSDLFPFLIAGIVAGSLYGVTAMGLVLTYRTSGIFNFGHGAIAAGAAYLFYELRTLHSLPWPVAAAVRKVRSRSSSCSRPTKVPAAGGGGGRRSPRALRHHIPGLNQSNSPRTRVGWGPPGMSQWTSHG